MKTLLHYPAMSMALVFAALLQPACVLAQAAPAAPCPTFGWQEGLGRYQAPAAPFPIDDTRNPAATTNCTFQQWAAEAFVWATAPDANGMPRFLGLNTPDQLQLGAARRKVAKGKPLLRLGARSLIPHGQAGHAEGANAIVEADGNMLVAPNGYPVYASAHMNASYFKTAQANLIADGGYQRNPDSAYFNPGDVIFKATWLRLDAGQAAPAGAYTTLAEVPKLGVISRRIGGKTVGPLAGQVETVTVALVGLHIVGYTLNHPEFVWATFEHNLNAPQAADNTFSTTGSSPNNYTFYAANTPYSQVNLPNPPQGQAGWTAPALQFDPLTQRFSPASNVVLENKTGGASFGATPAQDIANVTLSMSRFFQAQKAAAQALFQNYSLVGTVWLDANYYVTKNLPALANPDFQLQTAAIGSLNLANVTAETFVQAASTAVKANVQNCFMCHNAQSFSPTFAARRIGISHLIAYGSSSAVPNLINLTSATPPKK